MNEGTQLLTWHHATHYHCRQCSAELIFLRRLPWQPGDGVRALGVCPRCSMLLVEREKGVSWQKF